MESINQQLFLLINAPEHPAHTMLMLAIFLAEYLIWIIPAVLISGWLLGNERLRKVVITSALASTLALLANQVIGLIWHHPRPFMIGLGNNFVWHVADSSMPSDHLTFFWAAALIFCLHTHTRWFGMLLATLGVPMAWARVYVGVHFPFDMIGALGVAAISAWLVRYQLSKFYLDSIYQIAIKAHKILGLPN